MAASGAAAEFLHHARAQRVVAAGGRYEFGERESAFQRVFLVESVEGHELGVHQHGAGGVLAVVGQGVAVAVEDLGGARLAHAQPRPDHGAAERGQPQLVAHARRAHGATAIDRSHSRPARTSATTITVSATRAGVARANPQNVRKGKRGKGRGDRGGRRIVKKKKTTTEKKKN